MKKYDVEFDFIDEVTLRDLMITAQDLIELAQDLSELEKEEFDAWVESHEKNDSGAD